MPEPLTNIWENDPIQSDKTSLPLQLKWQRLNPAIKEKFVRRYAETGELFLTAHEFGSSGQEIIEERKKDAEFDYDCREAEGAHADLIQRTLRIGGTIGFKKPIIRDGIKVGETLVRSDRLLEKYLTALRPEKFAEKQRQIHGQSNASGVLGIPKDEESTSMKGWTNLHGKVIEGELNNEIELERK